ncbi:MAG: L-2-amino-thiazoline-4-carboxylic acid hydrolase [Blastocatellia bacterium]|nr:L-2-amino-thiazoline-4-carboxylic acid hydrolase [Blastocatellia bacterium]
MLQSKLRNTRPHHSFGVDHFLRFMEWDNALYCAMQEHGMLQEQAQQLIEDINWEIFGAGTSIGFKFTRLRSGRLQTRVQTVLDLMFAVLFTKPFRKHHVESKDGIAFDVVACPIAEYFRQQGLPELTRFAACNLDHRMAQVWGVKLERSQTLAAGDARCDFRFKIPTKDAAERY